LKPEIEEVHSTMADHKLLPRQYMVLALVSLCAPLGDSCLSRGMTSLPAISLAHPATLIAAVFTPWIAVGIALLIGFFASYLTALSWADLTDFSRTLGGNCADYSWRGLCSARAVTN
jgi:hypothetical protein